MQHVSILSITSAVGQTFVLFAAIVVFISIHKPLTYKTLYNKLNKEVKEAANKHEQTQWENKCNKLDLQDNQDRTWKTLKAILGTANRKPRYPTLKKTTKEGTTHAITTKDKVQMLQETLEQVYTHTDEDIPYDEEFASEVEFTIQHKQHILRTHYQPTTWKMTMPYPKMKF